MKRVALFLATNLAIVLVLSVSMRLLGVEPYLNEQGLNLNGLLVFAAVMGFGAAATGIGFCFATTYALGQITRRCYAGGRQMSTAVLQDTYRNLLGPARQLQTQYLPQIEQKVGTIDATQIAAMMRGA